MQDVRRKKPIKYNKDGSISLDGSGVKILRLLEPQGEPDVIECDGTSYVEAKHILTSLEQAGAKVVLE